MDNLHTKGHHMLYKFSEKLAAHLKTCILRVERVSQATEGTSYEADRIVLNCPIHPLPLPGEYLLSFVEVTSEEGPVRVVLPCVLPDRCRYAEMEALFRTIQSGENIRREDLSAMLEDTARVVLLRGMHIRPGDRENAACLYRDMNIREAVEELPAECIQSTLSAAVGDLNEARLMLSDVFCQQTKKTPSPDERRALTRYASL